MLRTVQHLLLSKGFYRLSRERGNARRWTAPGDVG